MACASADHYKTDFNQSEVERSVAKSFGPTASAAPRSAEMPPMSRKAVNRPVLPDQTLVDEAMIEKLVRTFYTRARQNPRLGRIFSGALGDDWEPHMTKLVDFWSSVMLSSGRYRGRPIPAHARLPDLRPEDFDVWLGLFRSVAQETCPPGAAAAFIDKAERIAASMMLMMATERGSQWLPPPHLRVTLGGD